MSPSDIGVRYRVGNLRPAAISTEALEQLLADVSTTLADGQNIDPTGFPVSFAFLPPGTEPDETTTWSPGVWVTTGAGYTAAINVGEFTAGRTITGTITLHATTQMDDAADSFTPGDVGRLVSGTDIAAGTEIEAYVSTGTVTLDRAATGSLSGGTVTLSDDPPDTVTLAAGEFTAWLKINGDPQVPVLPVGFVTVY